MQRLLRYHQHPVLSIFPHILVHILRGHRHAASTCQQLHLNNVPFFKKVLRNVIIRAKKLVCNGAPMKLVQYFKKGVS